MATIVKTPAGTWKSVALTPDGIAQYRDERLSQGLSGSTVRLDACAAVLSLFFIIMQKIKKFMNCLGLVDRLRDCRIKRPPDALWVRYPPRDNSPVLSIFQRGRGYKTDAKPGIHRRADRIDTSHFYGLPRRQLLFFEFLLNCPANT